MQRSGKTISVAAQWRASALALVLANSFWVAAPASGADAAVQSPASMSASVSASASAAPSASSAAKLPSSFSSSLSSSGGARAALAAPATDLAQPLLQAIIRGQDASSLISQYRSTHAVPGSVVPDRSQELRQAQEAGQALGNALQSLQASVLPTASAMQAGSSSLAQWQAAQLMLEARLQSIGKRLQTSGASSTHLARHQALLTRQQATVRQISDLLTPFLVAAGETPISVTPDPDKLNESARSKNAASGKPGSKAASKSVNAQTLKPGSLQAAAKSALALLGTAPVPREPVLNALSLPVGSLNLPQRSLPVAPAITPSYATASEVAVQPSDLAASLAAPLSDEILAQARALNNDYVRIYEFVRNTRRNQWYAGSVKGAEGVLRSGSGNDVDQASLLLALLRASGVAGRYVQGVAELPLARLANDLGLADETLVPQALGKAGIAFAPVVRGGRVAAVQVAHTWVSAYVPYTNYRGAVVDGSGKSWIPLDPSFKESKWTPSKVALSALGGAGALQDAYLAQPQNQSFGEFVAKKAQDLLQAQGGGAVDPATLFGQQQIVPLNLNLMPNALPYPVLAVTGEQAQLPEAQVVAARIVIRSGNQSNGPVVFDTTLPLHEINNQRLTLSYAPASLEDHRLTLAFGGLDAVPLYLIQLRPQLSVGGKVRALGSSGVDAGADLTLEIGLSGPFGSQRVTQNLLAGAFQAIILGNEPTRPVQAVAGDAESPGAGLLDGIALAYQQQWRHGESNLARLSGVPAVNPVPAVLLVSNQMQVVYLGDAPHTLAWQGVTLDAISHPLEAPGPGAADFMALSGLHGSSLESLVFQRQFSVDAISADKGLALARTQNLPVLNLTSSNAASLDASNHGANVKAHIRNLLRLGYRVEVPASRQTVSAWQGSSWRALDSNSGASGYFISGSLAGGATATPAEAWTLGFLADALRTPNADPYNSDPLSGVSLLKIGSGDGQIQTVGQALDEPLAVLVQDKDGMPVKGAQVRFQVVMGGGRFGETDMLDTTTNMLGIARAPLTMGTSTNDNPIYANLNPGDKSPARMSWHVIDVSSQAKNGVLHIDTPFTAVARPDAMSSLRRSSPVRNGGFPAIWVDTLSVMAEDQYGNPVPNIALNFATSTQQMCTGTGGDQHFRPGVVFNSGCPTSIPHLGDCGSNLLVAHSSSFGSAHVGVILGNDAMGKTRVDVSAGGRNLSVTYLANGQCSAGSAFMPMLELSGKVVDANGVSVAAASPSTQYKVEMTSAVSYSSMPYEVRNGRMVFFPFVSYVPTRADVDFVVDGGGFASGKRQSGLGHFHAMANMGRVPFNHEFKANFSNIEILYPVLIDKVVQTERAIFEGSIKTDGLYAVTASITKLQTDAGGNKIVLDVGGNNANNLALQYEVLPTGYTALSVDMNLYENGQFKTFFVSSRLTSAGAVLIPRGQPFDVNKTYEVELVLNRGTMVEIRSPKFPLELRQKLIGSAFARSARLDVDVLNKRACDRPGAIFFSFTQDVLASLSIVPLDSQGSPNGAERVLFKDKPYGMGNFDYQLDASQLGSGDFRFELKAVGVRDSSQEESANGGFSVLLKATNSLPVGQVIVKGVKVKDGGMSLQSQSLASSGHGPALHFQPSYSTGSNGQIGLMGTNWSHNFESSLSINSCGEVLVSAGDGGAVRFFPTNDGKLVPDLGYHATLERNDADHSFDFFSKDGTRYHYKFINEHLQWMVDLIEDRNGNTLTMTYDMQALPEPRLVSVLALDGREFKFNYLEQTVLVPGASARQPFLSQVTGPGGMSMDFKHDPFGNLTEINRNGRVEKFSYNTGDSNFKMRSLMLGSTDPNGNLTSYSYNQGSIAFDSGSSHIVLPNSMVTGITTPTGKVQFDIDTASFKKTSVTDENGNVTRYTLNDYGNPLSIADPAGTTTMTWATDDINMLSKTDARGVVTNWEWDKAGNMLSETTAGFVTANTWRVQGARPWIKNLLLSHTDRNNNQTRYSYDSHGNRLSEERPSGGTLFHTYSGNGDLMGTKDGNGGATQFGWNASGNLISTINPVGARTMLTRDTRGRVTQETDPNGNVTTYQYDSQDRMSMQANALGGTKSFAWDANGNKIKEVDEAGHATSWTYNSLNLPTGISRADGNSKTMHYDAVGNKTAESDYRGNLTTFTYDGVNRLLVRTEPLGKTTRYAYDAVGNLVSETDALGGITSHGYNDLNQRVSTKDTGGGQWLMSYDGNGNKTGSSDALQRSSSFSYDGQNRQTQQNLPLGHNTSFTYDANGNKTSEKDANGAVTQFRYDGANRLVQVTDKNGKVISYQYDPNNNLLRTIDQNLSSTLLSWDALNRKQSSKDGVGYMTGWQYDAVGNLAGEMLPNGNAINYTYDVVNRRIGSSDSLGLVGTWTYDADGNLTSEQDANGNTSSHGWNALNQKTGSNLPAGRTLGFGYDLLGNRTSSVDPNGNRTGYNYDALYRLIATQDAKGGTRAVRYDAVGNKVGETDPNGNSTTWHYDDLNRAISVVDALGQTISYQYDRLGNKTGEVNKRGIASSMTYDRMQRLLGVSKDGTPILQYRYDDKGNLIASTDANGNATTYEYDRRDLRVAENRLLGAITRLKLDAMGDVLTSTDPEGRVSSQSFDLRRRVVSSSNGAGETTRYSYDGVGNRLGTARPAGNTTQVSYDAAHRAVQINDGAGSTSYAYDKNGNHTRVQDANGNSTSTTFDELNRRIGISYAGGGSESFGYDGNGNLVSHKDGNGILVSHAYDALNRETSKTYSASADGLSSISTSYDPNNNVISVVQAMTGGNQSSSYSYDNFDRQQSHTDPFGAKAITSYDPNGNKTSLITQDGKVSRYSYDALNRLTNLTGQSGSISYSWDRSGLNTGLSYSNGVASSIRFDAAKRIQSVLHAKGSTALSRTEYGYDSNSNRTRETINRVGGAQSTSYSYDAADRLTRTVLTDPNQSVTTIYELDAVGNRSKETVNTQAGNAPATILSKTYRYDGRNQLTAITDSSAGDTALSYDNQGNLIRKTRGSDITHYVYNARDNLISVSKNATLLGAYTNDHLGLRVEKEAKDPQQPNAPPVKLRTLWDGRNAFQDSDTSGQVQTRYENNGRHPVAMWSKNDGSQALHQDALGSIVATTDSSGALKSETIYDAFGNITTQSGSSANKFGYTGHQMDNETGLIYFQARYYDPQLGRFITQDPFEGDWMTPMSLHHYLYAYGNPTTYIDLHGYSSTCFSDNPANCRSDAENAKVNQQRDQARQASIEDTSNSERYRKDHDSGENWKPGRSHDMLQEGKEVDTQVAKIRRDYEENVRTPAKRAHRTGQRIADAGYDTVDTLRPTPATVLAGPGAKILVGAGAKLASKLATSSRAAVGRVEAKVAEATKAGQAEGRAAEKAEGRSAGRAEDVEDVEKAVGPQPKNPLLEDAIPRNGKRKVVNQGNAPTCGHNSCGMVLDTKGKPADIDAMIKQIAPTESGIVSDEVAKLLKLNGLSANSWRGRNVSDLARYTKDGTPVVVRIIDKEGGSTFSHFVVVDGVTTRGGKSVVSIRDPHGIQYHSPVSTFEKNFTGEVIVPRK